MTTESYACVPIEMNHIPVGLCANVCYKIGLLALQISHEDLFLCHGRTWGEEKRGYPVVFRVRRFKLIVMILAVIDTFVRCSEVASDSLKLSAPTGVLKVDESDEE